MAIILPTGFTTGTTHTARKHGYNSFYRICHRNDPTEQGSMAANSFYRISHRNDTTQQGSKAVISSNRIYHRNDSTQQGSMAITLSTGFATGMTAHS